MSSSQAEGTANGVQIGGPAAALYDGLDLAYRRAWGESLHHGLWEARVPGGRSTASSAAALEAFERKVLESLELVLPRAGATGGCPRVIDVGCGYGLTAARLVRDLGVEVSAYTVSSRQADGARRRLETIRGSGSGDGNRVHLLDWCHNRETTASADAVISLECVCHVSDWDRFYAEVARVLVPGGRLVLTCWLAKGEREGWRERCFYEPFCEEGALARVADLDEHVTRLRSVGLQLERSEDLGRAVAPTWSCMIRSLLSLVASDADFRAWLLEAWPLTSSRIAAVPRTWLGFASGLLGYGWIEASRPT